MTDDAGEIIIAKITRDSKPEVLRDFFTAASSLLRVGKAVGLKFERKQVGQDRYAAFVDVLSLTALKEDAR